MRRPVYQDVLASLTQNALSLIRQQRKGDLVKYVIAACLVIEEKKMKRFITNDDLAALVTKASTLRKLAQSAQKISADLDVEEGYMKVADKSIGRGHALLQNRALRPKQRAKVEEQLERDQQFLYCAELEYWKKNPAFSELVSQIESVLRELATIYVAEGH